MRRKTHERSSVGGFPFTLFENSPVALCGAVLGEFHNRETKGSPEHETLAVSHYRLHTARDHHPDVVWLRTNSAILSE